MMKKKLKLAYIIPGLFYPSGMERVLTAKVNYFVQHFDYEVHIFVTDGKGMQPYYPLDKRISLHHLDINFDGIFAFSLVKRTALYWKKQRLLKKRLEKELCAIRPDITVSLLRRDVNFINDLKDGSLKVGELHFNRLVYRQFTDKRFPAFMQKAITKMWQKQLLTNLQKLAAFVVLTQEDAGYWFPLNNVSVIPNPLPFFPDEPALLDNKQVIAVGRMTYQKGFDLLIKSWKQVVEQHPDWTLKIYGGGDKKFYQALIDELNLMDSCFLEDATDAIAEKYYQSSIFVLSSRYEGFGMVLVEAMAYGVPPVAFMCPCGPKDLIEDGQNGLLVENGQIGELAERISFLMADESERKRMGANARSAIKRLEIEPVANEWKGLFESLCPLNT